MFKNEKFKRLRNKRKLSQRDIAKTIGVSHKTILRWESAYTIPSEFNIRTLADVLQISVSEISTFKENQPAKPYFYNNLGQLDKSTFDLSTKTDTEKQKILINLQRKNEILLWEKNEEKFSRKEFSEIINSLDVMIYKKNGSLKFTFVNDYFLSQFSLKNKSSILGRRNSDIWEKHSEWREIIELEKKCWKQVIQLNVKQFLFRLSGNLPEQQI